MKISAFFLSKSQPKLQMQSFPGSHLAAEGISVGAALAVRVV